MQTHTYWHGIIATGNSVRDSRQSYPQGNMGKKTKNVYLDILTLEQPELQAKKNFSFFFFS